MRDSVEVEMPQVQIPISSEDIVIDYLFKNQNKAFSLNQICVATGIKSGGGISSSLKRAVNMGKIKSLVCPCGFCTMYYIGKIKNAY